MNTVAGARASGIALLVALFVALLAMSALAQPAATEVSLTAASANVSEPGSPVTIRIFRWSTDEERTPIVAALSPPPPAATRTASEGEGGTEAGRAAASGRAGGARAGRGGGRGGRGPAAPLTPIAALTAAIGRAPTIGYLWTNDVTGYAIKYAHHVSQPDRSERIILATDRRLGAYSPAWRPSGPAPLTDYDFTLIEIRLDPRGVGEGKTSLSTQVMVDSEARSVALDGYAAAPALLQNVKR